MDPLSALIGGGFSLLGGVMGSNATQAANQANIQQAQWQATGGYLPGLISNAKAAGINPLAVLPGGGGSANIQPVNQVGSSLGDIGQNLSRMSVMTSPHDATMNALQERRARADAEGAELQNTVLRHNVSNIVGSPNLGSVHVGRPSVSGGMRGVTGEKLDFPYNVLGQTADLGLAGFDRFANWLNTFPAVRASEDWINRGR